MALGPGGPQRHHLRGGEVVLDAGCGSGGVTAGPGARGIMALGQEVLQRIDLRGDEVVLAAGCGSGELAAELAARVPRGRVYAVDGSPRMVELARERLGVRRECHVWVSDLLELEVPEPVDLVFSAATFHWIADHERLFERLRAAL